MTSNRVQGTELDRCHSDEPKRPKTKGDIMPTLAFFFRWFFVYSRWYKAQSRCSKWSMVLSEEIICSGPSFLLCTTHVPSCPQANLRCLCTCLPHSLKISEE